MSTKLVKIVAVVGSIGSILIAPLAMAQTTTDYTASISTVFTSLVDPLVTGSWHYLNIVMKMAAGFAIFWFAIYLFWHFVRRR